MAPNQTITGSPSMHDQRRRARMHKSENDLIEERRTGEYRDCVDLMDFYEHRLTNLPIKVVPRPESNHLFIL